MHHERFSPSLRRRALAAGGVILACAFPLRAQTTTFTGPGPDWSDALNWDNGLPSATAAVLLGDHLASRLDADFAIAQLDVLAGHRAELTAGTQLTVTGAAGITLRDGAALEDFGAGGAEVTALALGAYGWNSFAGVFRAGDDGGDRTLSITKHDAGDLRMAGTIALGGAPNATLNLQAFSSAAFETGLVRIDGAITDDGAASQTTLVNVSGGGRVMLAGDNTYSGVTRVRGGITLFPGGGWISGGLVIAGDPLDHAVSATGSSAVEVVNRGGDTGVLSGQGRIGGDLHLQGGLFLPGNGDGFDIGTVSLGGDFLATPDPVSGATGEILLDVDPLNTQGRGVTDLILLTSPAAQIDLSGASLGIFVKSLPADGQVLRFLDAPVTATLTGTFLNWAAQDATNTYDFGGTPVTFRINYGANFVELIAIPEPATYALLLALATLALVLARRRRTRRAVRF